MLQADAEISVLKDIVVDNVKWKLTNKYTKPKDIWEKKIAEHCLRASHGILFQKLLPVFHPVCLGDLPALKNDGMQLISLSVMQMPHNILRPPETLLFHYHIKRCTTLTMDFTQRI